MARHDPFKALSPTAERLLDGSCPLPGHPYLSPGHYCPACAAYWQLQGRGRIFRIRVALTVHRADRYVSALADEQELRDHLDSARRELQALAAPQAPGWQA